MPKLAKSDTLDTLGLSAGDHLVRFHVESDSISYEIAESKPLTTPTGQPQPGFVKRWGGTATPAEDGDDPWLSRINEKHLR